MTMKDAVSVGIHHKRGLMGSVEDDAVGSLRANAVEAEKFRAQFIEILAKKILEIAPPMILDVLTKGLHFAGFLIVIAGRADKRCQLGQG